MQSLTKCFSPFPIFLDNHTLYGWLDGVVNVNFEVLDVFINYLSEMSY